MRFYFLRYGVLSIVTTLLSISVVMAQALTCPALVEQALTAVGDNCANTGRNEGCYGYDLTEASFLVEVDDDTFTQPTDIVAVADLETIRTAPLNVDTGVWGVAVLRLQANVPNTLPGQAVTFVLMGDVEVENAVDPDAAFQPVDGTAVTVNVEAGANVRSGPGRNFNVIGAARNGESLVADGLSEDGEWLRVVHRERPAWVSRTVVDDSDPAVAELPVLTADRYTPMQAFYLRTGIGQPECEEAPDNLMLVQGPRNIDIEFTVNGANIQIGSSGALRVVEIDGELFLEIIVFDGEFRVGDVVIGRGEHSLICLGEEGSRGLDGTANDLIVTCDPTPPEAVDLDILGDDWCVLEDVPSDILNYPLDVPCPGETPTPAGGGGGATQSQLPGVNCSGFRLLSPLFPVDPGNQVFSWTAARGDNITYELVFYTFDGNQAETFLTQQTSYALNLGSQTSTGGEFSWEVRAYQNGAYACVTFRSPQLTRLGAPEQPTGPSTFALNVSCIYTFATSYYNATISWTGLSPTASITAILQSPPYGSPSQTSGGQSGTINLSVNSFASGSVRVVTSEGFQATYPCT